MLRRLLILLIPAAPLGAAEKPVSYAFEVRPILSDKCFACHGPDAAKRESGLRLDNAEGAAAPLKDSPGSAIVPGDLSKSAAWQRIISHDPEQVMPPPPLDRGRREVRAALVIPALAGEGGGSAAEG
jgi:hypothetical protein